MSIFKPQLSNLFKYCSGASPGELKRSWCYVLNCEFFSIGAFAVAGTGNKRVFLISSVFHISYMFVLIISNANFLTEINTKIYIYSTIPLLFIIWETNMLKNWFFLILYICRFNLKAINSGLLCKKIYWLERQERKERGEVFKLRYIIMEYNQLFIYLYTILSSVARVLLG